MAEKDLQNPENNFEGIDKETFERLKSHVSFSRGDFDLSDEFRKEVVMNILEELNWNHVYRGYDNDAWSEPPGFSGGMGS